MELPLFEERNSAPESRKANWKDSLKDSAPSATKSVINTVINEPAVSNCEMALFKWCRDNCVKAISSILV